MSHDVNDPTGEIPPLPSELRLAIDTSKITAPSLTVADLSAKHIGERVRIRAPREQWEITGTLYRADHEADQITDSALCDAEVTTIAGPTSVSVVVGPFEFTSNGTATVEVL